MDVRSEFSASAAAVPSPGREPSSVADAGICESCGSCPVGTRFCMVCGAQRSTALTFIGVSHMVGPMWSVHGAAIAASTTAPRTSLLQRAVQGSGSEAPWRIALYRGEVVERVVVTSTRTVVDVLDTAAPWGVLEPALPDAGEHDPLKAERLVLVGAHAGAGTSTWAQLLHGDDAELAVPAVGRIVVVCRSVPSGIAAAKRLIRDVGPDRVRAVLVIADAPGKPVPAAAREQRVLAGANTVAFAPWMPRLRGVTEISAALDGQLARAVQRVSKALVGASAEKKDK